MKKIKILVAIPLFICIPTLAKKNCEQAMKNLKSHQAIMRNGYSAPESEKLRVKERKLFNTYQSCLKSPLRQSKKKKNKKKQNNKTSYITNPIDRPEISWQNRSLSFRGKFSGKKQEAWLAFYKQPKKCIKPESLQVFAWCTEHKAKSSEQFSELWHSK